jgi:hypothetical protein
VLVEDDRVALARPCCEVRLGVDAPPFAGELGDGLAAGVDLRELRNVAVRLAIATSRIERGCSPPFFKSYLRSSIDPRN